MICEDKGEEIRNLILVLGDIIKASYTHSRAVSVDDYLLSVARIDKIERCVNIMRGIEKKKGEETNES